jgi:HPt (histidine-containing phosphotransfer) domain-containing protein
MAPTNLAASPSVASSTPGPPLGLITRQCHFEVVQQRIVAGTALDRDMLDQLREDLGGTAALREAIRSFPIRSLGLRDAAARADVHSIRQAAHMIKVTSSTLGARELSEQCAEIERIGQTGCIADAGSRVIAVEASYRTIEAALKAEIERFRP